MPGSAESEFNVCRKEEGQGNAVGNSLLQVPETLPCSPSEISDSLPHQACGSQQIVVRHKYCCLLGEFRQAVEID